MTIRIISGNRQDYNNAIQYLKRGSNKACAILMHLNMMTDEINVIVKENLTQLCIEGSRYIPPDGFKPATIHWWVYDWTDVGNTPSGNIKFMNPAMALIHELGHAFQHYRKGLKMTRRNVWKVENDNVLNYEKPIAIELGQPYRNFYKDSNPMGDREELFRAMGKGPMRALKSYDGKNF